MSSLIGVFLCKISTFVLILYVICAGADDGKLLSKRQEYDDFHVCAQNFEIHQDKIIRTEESKRMGAKYLSGKDVSSKDECVKFCCETPNCNVFVLEEKVFNQQSGTCYLFECGTPDNFKCKFTRHHNYSSAVLIINRPQMQLEDEIQYTQHERELTNLRTVEHNTKTKNCNHTAKPNAINDNHLNEIKELAKPEEINKSLRKPSRCSRYQFECRTSGECIAIYNACDGIPQCADHSDEDSELGCPTNAPVIYKKLTENTLNDKQQPDEANVAFPDKTRVSVPFKGTKDKPQQEVNVQELMKNQIPDLGVINRQTYDRQYKVNQWQNQMNQQSYNNVNPSEVQNYQVNGNIDPRMVPQHPPSGTGYGREGEMMDTNPWAGKNTETRVFKQSYGPLHNFNHKQNDINIPYNYAEHNNLPMNIPYDKNGRYPGGVVYQPNPNWYPRSPSSNYEPERTFPDSKNNEPPRNRIVPEYFYEDVNTPVTKNAEPVSQGGVSPKTMYNVTAISSSQKKFESTPQVLINMTKSTTQSLKQTNAVDVTTTVAKNETEAVPVKQTVEKSNEQNAHRKLEKQFSAEIVDAREHLLDVNVMDGYTEQPSGAFISLTLGLCVTAIMVFVVGCRLKVVRKRIRRGGKAPYAHDADFLVNGMYL